MMRRKNTKPFLTFLMTGGFNTLLCLLVYWLLIQVNVPYLLASTLMFIYGVIQGYLFSAFFVFQQQAKWQNLLKYSMVYVCSYVFNIAILYVCVTDIGVSKFMGQVITSLLVATLNYVLVKKMVFKEVVS